MKIQSRIIKVAVLFFASWFLTHCGGGSSSGSSASSSVPPVAYCSTAQTHSGGFTFIGQAQYQFRAAGNGVVAGPNPIRFAEVRVTDSAGNLIQCGETDGSGVFSIQLPTSNDTATITVASRADNSNLKVYILNNPTNNAFHSISTSISLDGATTSGTLTAPATGTLEGGAFHILDEIYKANLYLKNATANCAATYTGCTPFTVAPLVHVYWSKGVNPSSYFGISSAASFYVPEDNHLFILGGVNGDVDNSDTDHFDDSIIIHEYGHYIENTYSITDSPGGFHNGNMILDPRLAFGEAWANFFQARVTGVALYRDTYGTPEGNPGVFANMNLESGTNDTSTVSGEGNFREFSITRALVDMIDADESNAQDDLQTDFAEFWTIFTSPTLGLANSALNFRSIGLFYQLQSAYANKTDWSTIQNAENQAVSRAHYATPLTVPAACGNIAIQAKNMPGADSSLNENGTPQNSNQFDSNDFYQYTHSGGALSIVLSYSTTPGNAADLDLYLYKNDYTFGDSASVLGSSEDTIGAGDSGDNENLVIGNLAAGTYMINVNYFTGNGIKSSAAYNLTINGQQACP